MSREKSISQETIFAIKKFAIKKNIFCCQENYFQFENKKNKKRYAL